MRVREKSDTKVERFRETDKMREWKECEDESLLRRHSRDGVV